MTREDIIEEHYCCDPYREWCSGNCDWCKRGFENDLAEYENEIRADAIDKFANRMKKLVNNWFYSGVIHVADIDKTAEKLKDSK